MSNQFYVFVEPGMCFNSSIVIRASSPQKAMEIYKSEFSATRSRSDIALFVCDSLKFHDFTLLRILKA